MLVVDNGQSSGDKIQELARMAQDRNAKLKKYQEKKELDDQIKLLKVAMEREQVDDEIKRDFYLKLLKSCVLEAHEELVSISQEKQILEHIAVMRRNEPEHQHKPPKGPAPKPLKPIIITRDAAQKAVYGLGYPSLPTMTVAEFYEQRVAEGIFPDAERMKEVNKNSLMNRVFQDNAAELDKEDEEKVKDFDSLLGFRFKVELFSFRKSWSRKMTRNIWPGSAPRTSSRTITVAATEIVTIAAKSSPACCEQIRVVLNMFSRFAFGLRWNPN